MKREDVRSKIPGITDEQLDWLMQENGADINAEKSASTRLQGELDTANATIKSLQDAAKKYDGVDVDGLQQQITTLQEKYNRDISGLRRDRATLVFFVTISRNSTSWSLAKAVTLRISSSSASSMTTLRIWWELHPPLILR